MRTKVDGDYHLEVSGNVTEVIGGSQTINVDKTINISAAEPITLSSAEKTIIV